MVKKESAEILNRPDPVCFGSGMILFMIRIPLSGSFRIRILSPNTAGVSKILDAFKWDRSKTFKTVPSSAFLTKLVRFVVKGEFSTFKYRFSVFFHIFTAKRLNLYRLCIIRIRLGWKVFESMGAGSWSAKVTSGRDTGCGLRRVESQSIN
jgi:hypothetical protein